jgi:hypothetical protein
VWLLKLKLKIETKMRKGKYVSKIKRIKNQNHTCTIHRNTTNSSIPLGSNIQFSTNIEKEQVIKKKLVTMNK